MCDLALAAASIGFAQKAMAIAVVPIAMASVITFVVAIAVRSERAFLASVLTLAGACAVADLPVHRNGAAVFASVAGAAVLVFVEAGGAALEPRGAGTRVGRPATTQAVWVGLVAVGGASAGWLLLSLEPEVSDLGLAALGIGVLAAVCRDRPGGHAGCRRYRRSQAHLSRSAVRATAVRATIDAAVATLSR